MAIAVLVSSLALRAQPGGQVADGFSLASVGDLVAVRVQSVVPYAGFRRAVSVLRDADVAFGNFEGTALDLSHFRGYPQAESGGGWLITPPAALRDLRTLGFTMLSCANNHATDWGIEGMRETARLLDEAGIVHAGTGEDRAAARAARYLDTPKGRIAMVAMASSFTPLSRATSALGEVPGRPGLNALRTTRYLLVDPPAFQAIQSLRDKQPKGALSEASPGTSDTVDLYDLKFKRSDHFGETYEMHPVDEQEILKSIRQGRANADFLIATIHAHEPGNWSDEPADFVPRLAHAAIDNGADVFIVHGPHQLRGIEIYHGKPIFYSLANFVFHLNLEEPAAWDLYEQLRLDPNTMLDAELNEKRRRQNFGNEIFYQSVIAVSRFRGGKVPEIRLFPVDLGAGESPTLRGIPRLADRAVAKTILERLDRLSRPFGVSIAMEHDQGVIRPAEK